MTIFKVKKYTILIENICIWKIHTHTPGGGGKHQNMHKIVSMSIRPAHSSLLVLLFEKEASKTKIPVQKHKVARKEECQSSCQARTVQASLLFG